VTIVVCLLAAVAELALCCNATARLTVMDAPILLFVVGPFLCLATIAWRQHSKLDVSWILLVVVIGLSAWGLYVLGDDAYRYHAEANYRKTQRLAVFYVPLVQYVFVALVGTSSLIHHLISFDKKKTSVLFGLIFVVCMANDARSQQRHFGRLNGKSVSVVLANAQLDRASNWNEAKDAEPPLSIGRAIQLAKAAVATKYPSLKEENWVVTVTLGQECCALNTDQHFTDEDGEEYYKARDKDKEIVIRSCWVYWVRLRSQPVMGNGLAELVAPNIPVAVMMDGETILPTMISKPLPESEFKEKFRRIETRW
jgi:hypothetical protein